MASLVNYKKYRASPTTDVSPKLKSVNSNLTLDVIPRKFLPSSINKPIPIVVLLKINMCYKVRRWHARWRFLPPMNQLHPVHCEPQVQRDPRDWPDAGCQRKHSSCVDVVYPKEWHFVGCWEEVFGSVRCEKVGKASAVGWVGVFGVFLTCYWPFAASSLDLILNGMINYHEFKSKLILKFTLTNKLWLNT